MFAGSFHCSAPIARLTIIPLAFQVDHAVIAEDPNFTTGRPFAQTDGLQVSARLWPLLHGNVKIDSLTLTMNRVRQAAITKEIIEIVSGAAAIG